MRRFQLGKLPLALHGDAPFADAIAAEFAPIGVPADATAAPAPLAVHVVSALPAIGDAVLMAPVTVAPQGFAHTVGRVRYQVRRTDGTLEVFVHAPASGALRGLMPRELQRATHFNYLDYWERRVKSFVYDVFDYAAQSAQLPLGQSFIHASSLERDGAALALLAWGGIGKTTSMLKLVLEDGWRFLSDDLGLVDAGGMLYRSPKHLQVYGYNLMGQPAIEGAFFGGRSTLDRLSWSTFKLWKGNHRIRRRVSAESLFGPERVARQGKLSQAIFLERHLGRDFVRRPLTAAALAERCTAVLISEISPFAMVTCAVHGAGNHGTIPSVGEMHERTLAILTAAFGDVPCELVGIPKGAGPDALVDYLRPMIERAHRT